MIKNLLRLFGSRKGGAVSESDIVGGDKIGGDKVGGDKVSGNKGDTYDIKDSPGAGRDIRMENVSISQSRTEQIDLPTLARELEVLRLELKKQATDGGQDIAVGAVAQAQEEAKKGNESKALEYLAKAGQWALDVAVKIGVPVATEALKKSLGG